MERRLAAIVCADVAGYSRMMGADEAGTHATFKAHRSAIYPIILNHGGRLVKNTGDGFLLEFPSIVGAIEAAIAMQMVMAERNDHLPADRIMQFRMGIHMGDVMADEDEVFGDDVNIAVRLESVAAPGGLAVSGKACHEAGKRLSVPLVDAGPHRFKNIEEPIHVWTWQPAGTDASGPAPESSAETSVTNLPAQYRTAIVGVLPFANLSESADEYFSDGLTEDLIHALSLQSFYRVLSRNSTFPFKGKNLSTRLIAREIDASYLIQGSVRRAGNQDSHHRRADRAGDRRAVMDRPVRPRHRRPVRHAGRNHHQPVGGDRGRDLPGGSIRPAALELERPHRLGSFPERAFLLLFADAGRSRNLDRPVQGSHRARSDAVDRPRLSRHDPDPGHPVRMDQEHPRNVGLRDERLRKAVSGSIPVRPLPFRSLAYLNAAEGHYETAMDAAKRAVGLNPYDMGARGVLGICHLVSGEHRPAIELFTMAAQSGNNDPRYQWAAVNAFSHYLLGQYDASLSWAREQLYTNPNHASGTRDPRGGARPIGTNCGGGNGGRGSAQQLSRPYCRTALAQFPLEAAGRHRPLP